MHLNSIEMEIYAIVSDQPHVLSYATIVQMVRQRNPLFKVPDIDTAIYQLIYHRHIINEYNAQKEEQKNPVWRYCIST